jgi:hypothetical protein
MTKKCTIISQIINSYMFWHYLVILREFVVNIISKCVVLVRRNSCCKCTWCSENINKWCINLFRRLLNATFLNSLVIYRCNVERNVDQLKFRVEMFEGIVVEIFRAVWSVRSPWRRRHSLETKGTPLPKNKIPRRSVFRSIPYKEKLPRWCKLLVYYLQYIG